MATSPMVLHFYNEDSEQENEFIRTFVPWKMLKEAVKLQNIDENNLTEKDVDSITNLMVAVFGGKFTAEEAEMKADMTEMLAVLKQITNVAKGGLKENPTPQGK